MIGKEDKAFLMEQKILSLTKQESILIRTLNSALSVIRETRTISIPVEDKKIRLKEKERETIERYCAIMIANDRALKRLAATIGTNMYLAAYLNNNKPEETVLNNLQLYELRLTLIDNLKHLDDRQNIDILEDVLDRIQKILGWNSIAKIDKIYDLLELNFYKKLVTPPEKKK